jgi:hypothetical protein
MTPAVPHLLNEVAKFFAAEKRELRPSLAQPFRMSADLTENDFAALDVASFRALDNKRQVRQSN